jgi:hypothetical protein
MTTRRAQATAGGEGYHRLSWRSLRDMSVFTVRVPRRVAFAVLPALATAAALARCREVVDDEPEDARAETPSYPTLGMAFWREGARS